MKEKNAFTLAEVLITLGIIGVVAAMTLPALINNYQKKVYETAYAKSVNTILNAHKKLLADAEQFSLCDLEDFECNKQNSLDGISIRDGHLDSYMKKLGFQKKKVDLGVMGDNFDEAYVSKDGMCYYPFSLFTETHNSGGPTYEIFVDTNCSKNPNLGGRDQFFIVMNEKLKLTIDVTDDEDEIAEMCDELANGKPVSLASSVYAGIYCGSYLINNSYKMDY